MNDSNDNIRVVIPLTIRRRNGRPKILPPDGAYTLETRRQDPHILKAFGRAWAWRRRLENGEFATAGELAKMEGVTERFVSRTVRLAYMSPPILERILVAKDPIQLHMPNLFTSILSPWIRQIEIIDRCSP